MSNIFNRKKKSLYNLQVIDIGKKTKFHIIIFAKVAQRTITLTFEKRNINHRITTIYFFYVYITKVKQL